jgi:hypothetical protein
LAGTVVVRARQGGVRRRQGEHNGGKGEHFLHVIVLWGSLISLSARCSHRKYKKLSAKEWIDLAPIWRVLPQMLRQN